MPEGVYPSPTQLENSIYKIGNSVESDEIIIRYYQWLINHIPISELTPEQSDRIRNTLETILIDRINHNNILKNMYYQLTGNVVTIVEKEFAEPENFKIEIMEEFVRALEGIQKYRLIMFGLPSLYYRDLIYIIISDKIRHASLYNYILTEIANIK
jgi:rubrerythrin